MIILLGLSAYARSRARAGARMCLAQGAIHDPKVSQILWYQAFRQIVAHESVGRRKSTPKHAGPLKVPGAGCSRRRYRERGAIVSEIGRAFDMFAAGADVVGASTIKGAREGFLPAEIHRRNLGP